MLKEQLKLLDELVHEIETTIKQGKCRLISIKFNAPTRAVRTVDHKLLLDKGHLPIELINELEFLLQKYGNELIEFIKEQCPPLPLAAAISTFIFNKEKAKFRKLQTKLNPSKEPEDIKGFKLVDYLILGYQFYDALFFKCAHSGLKLSKFWWGIVYSSKFERPKGIENKEFKHGSSKSKLKRTNFI